MVIITDIYLTSAEIIKLADKTFTIAKASSYKSMPQQDGKEVEKLVVPVKLSNAKVRDWIPNKTSVRKIVELYGDNTDDWIGKKAEFMITKQNVRGDMKDVIFVK